MVSGVTESGSSLVPSNSAYPSSKMSKAVDSEASSNIDTSNVGYKVNDENSVPGAYVPEECSVTGAYVTEASVTDHGAQSTNDENDSSSANTTKSQNQKDYDSKVSSILSQISSSLSASESSTSDPSQSSPKDPVKLMSEILNEAARRGRLDVLESAAKAGMDCTVRDPATGVGLLASSVLSGDVEVVKHCLQNDAIKEQVNYYCRMGTYKYFTCLHVALSKPNWRDARILEALIEAGGDFSIPTSSINSSISEDGSPSTSTTGTQQPLEGTSKHASPGRGVGPVDPPAYTTRNPSDNSSSSSLLPIHYAAQTVDDAACKVILKETRKILSYELMIDGQFRTPLHYAVERIDSEGLTVVQSLYEAFPEWIDFKDFEGNTPIHYVCKTKNTSGILRLLCELLGSNINLHQLNSWDISPFMYLVARGEHHKFSIVKHLVPADKINIPVFEKLLGDNLVTQCTSYAVENMLDIPPAELVLINTLKGVTGETDYQQIIRAVRRLGLVYCLEIMSTTQVAKLSNKSNKDLTCKKDSEEERSEGGKFLFNLYLKLKNENKQDDIKYIKKLTTFLHKSQRGTPKIVYTQKKFLSMLDK